MPEMIRKCVKWGIDSPLPVCDNDNWVDHRRHRRNYHITANRTENHCSSSDTNINWNTNIYSNTNTNTTDGAKVWYSSNWRCSGVYKGLNRQVSPVRAREILLSVREPAKGGSNVVEEVKSLDQEQLAVLPPWIFSSQLYIHLYFCCICCGICICHYIQ